jgi:hypothetical protein
MGGIVQVFYFRISVSGFHYLRSGRYALFGMPDSAYHHFVQNTWVQNGATLESIIINL